MSFGHAAVNVVARVARIHSKTGSLDTKLRGAGLPAPFDCGRFANLSLNPGTVKSIHGVARQTGEVALADLVDPLDNLVKSAVWAALVSRRDAGYHRLRPRASKAVCRL